MSTSQSGAAMAARLAPLTPKTRGFLRIARHGGGPGAVYVITYHRLDAQAENSQPKPVLAEGAGAQGWTCGQWARAHAETGAKRRRNIAEKIAAAGADTFVAEGACGVGAEPVAARFALRIDALHGEAGQKLHSVSLSGLRLLRR